MTTLRPYQTEVISKITASTCERIIIVAPTGSGKTIIAVELIRATPGRVLFLAHRRELIHQACDRLADFGVDAGIILAGDEADPDQRVQVASIQTLWSRAMVRKSQELPEADLVFLDEAHHCRAKTYLKIIEAYPNAKIIGLTATPCRGDGRGLGNVFHKMIECPQVQDLIDLGHLVATKVWAPSAPDLTGVRTRMGDYVESDLAQALDKPSLVGDIVTHWHRLGQRRKTVVFAVDVAHSVHLKHEFVKSCVKAEHIDGSTPKEERDEILRRLSRGEIELVVNCMVLTEGWDQPDVSCIVLARPTKQMGLYRQMIGRGLRPFPGKPDCLVLDHSGATHRHGFVEDHVDWTLDVDKRADAPAHTARCASCSTTRLCDCPQCGAVRQAGKPCRVCGYLPRPRPNDVDVADGELVRFKRDGVQPITHTAEQKHDWYRQLTHICRQRGYQEGWIAHKFKDRFGHWPQTGELPEPKEPTPEVLAWERYTRIKYAKGLAKRQGDGQAR